MRLFISKSETKATIRKLMSLIVNNTSVKLLVFNNQAKKISGYYNYKERLIFINNNQTKKQMLQTFFHELAHHYLCSEQNKDAKYHKGVSMPSDSKEIFTIENNTDKIASRLWNKYVDRNVWGNYTFIYPKMHKNILTSWLTEYYK